MSTSPFKDLIPFQPLPIVSSGHAQTVGGSAFKMLWNTHLPEEKLITTLSDGDQIVSLANIPKPWRNGDPIVFMAHGLGRTARVHYMVRAMQWFYLNGWATFRMNLRACGDGLGYAKHLFHSGRTGDFAQVLKHLSENYPQSPIIAVGYSISGTTLASLAGSEPEQIPQAVRALITVSTPLDLVESVQALHESRNRIFNRHYLRALKQILKHHQMRNPDFPKFDFPKRMQMWDFDRIVTAPVSGFESHWEYYQKTSAIQHVDKIQLPTYFIYAQDDPFVPPGTYQKIQGMRHQHHLSMPHGGHLGFINRRKLPTGNRAWVDYTLWEIAQKVFKEG